MAKGAVVTVGTGATLVAQGPGQTRNAEPMHVYVTIGATQVDFGGTTVAWGTGFRPAASTTFGPFHLANNETLYAASQAGGVTVTVLTNYA
jgi:hypothetical protein